MASIAFARDVKCIVLVLGKRFCPDLHECIHVVTRFLCCSDYFIGIRVGKANANRLVKKENRSMIRPGIRVGNGVIAFLLVVSRGETMLIHTTWT